ncbi:hypothetical protein C0J52_12945 [Blattella germanica]|nr:hypothetical protein C0J52_12945 [Blattella germanica]
MKQFLGDYYKDSLTSLEVVMAFFGQLNASGACSNVSSVKAVTMLTCAVLLFLSGGCFASLPLPSYIKPCALDDPDFNECARNSATAAIPKFIHGDRKYKIPDLDPMIITELRITEGTQSVGMTMAAENALLSGLKNVDVRATRFDFDKKRIEYDWYFPNLIINCIYDVTGRVLLLPIVGHGNGTFNIKDLHDFIRSAKLSNAFGVVQMDLEKFHNIQEAVDKVLNLKRVDITRLVAMRVDSKTPGDVEGTYGYDYDLVKKKDDKVYMVPKNPHFEFKAKKLTIRLENLFNGDKFLGDNMNTFLNENWEDILKDVGPVIAEAIGQFINQILTNVFSIVTFSDAIPNTL